MLELKTCPFCGGKAEHQSEMHINPFVDPETGAYIDADVFLVESTGCPCCEIWFILGEDEEPDTTIEKWNRRANNDT